MDSTQSTLWSLTCFEQMLTVTSLQPLLLHPTKRSQLVEKKQGRALDFEGSISPGAARSKLESCSPGFSTKS